MKERDYASYIEDIIEHMNYTILRFLGEKWRESETGLFMVTSR